MTDNSKEELNTIISKAQEAIEKMYCMQLDTRSVNIVELDENISNIAMEEAVCLFHLRELVYSKEEGLNEKIATVLNAVNMCEGTLVTMIECKNGKAEIYIGVVNKKNYENVYYLLTLKNILQTGIQGNLPGTVLEEVPEVSEVRKRIQSMLGKGFDTQCITSISSSIGDLKELESVSGIDTIINSMGEESFTILILADAVNKQQAADMRFGYEELSTQLSALLNSSISVQKSESEAVSSTISESINQTLSQSISLTESHTKSSGWSTSENKLGGLSKKALMITSSCLIPGGGYMYGMLSGNQNQNRTGSAQTGKTRGETDGWTRGETYQEGITQGQTSTYGQTVQYTVENKTIRNLYSRIEKILESIEESDSTGMFSCCTYILSSNPATNKIVSSHYQSILRTAGKTAKTYGINTWTQDNGVEMVREYLCRFMHPRFRYRNIRGEGAHVMEPSIPISGRQLALHMILPHKAVPGLPVVEYASFGRNIVRQQGVQNSGIVKIGKIYHMGRVEQENQVYLDLQSLASHTFISGTNGSGKTNTVYKILEEIIRCQVKFMVIEPAKGEYKNAFGNDPDVFVYGTNPKKTPLLKLNPFQFHEKIHVLEHIDKLIEVFNACWPMYAAMPAVLKAAVENAYISSGWDIRNSVFHGSYIRFPTIKDVLRELNIQLDSSAFSGEVKGNYVGALSTRLESLCKGLFGQIFSGEDIGDKQLFEQNVIIDLSRAFSSETKSMIMGILILRLQEYRLSFGGMNLPLKHVTILEEAHHLLRRTSSEQSQDGANLLGKSVEMIANSIAEMRTYGEGFIIVDQSPGLLDMSVIRNTNTKILLRLPERTDRELTGYSMGLNEQQIEEIPRLKKGVCVIYQNDWLEAVLCKVDKAESSDDSRIYQYEDWNGEEKVSRMNEFNMGTYPMIPEIEKNEELKETREPEKENVFCLQPKTYSSISGVEPAFVYGNAFESADVLDGVQGDNPYSASGNCGLVTTANVLTLCGIKTSEEEITGLAVEHGLCNYSIFEPQEKRGGVNDTQIVQLLHMNGVEARILPAQSQAGSCEGIAEYVESGHGVAIGINSGIAWGRPEFIGDSAADHEITVTGTVRNEEGKLEGFIVCDSGCGEADSTTHFMSLNTLKEAYEHASGASAVVTDKAIRSC